MSLPPTMRAVVLNKPYEIKVLDQPTPTVQEAGDAIIKVHLAGLCGSDLHYYRGIEPADRPFIMGHEALGEIAAVGEGVKGFKVGDLVISAFSLSCGACFYCKQGYSARCTQNICLGGPTIPGAQAEYIRIPMASSSLMHVPTGIPKELALLLTDILPTGYSTAWNARKLGDEEGVLGLSRLGGEGKVEKKGVVVVIGCGPVGLCAITSATTLFSTVYATDLQPARLALAEKHGAIALPLSELRAELAKVTDGRGADAVLELVGYEGALHTAIELVRPYGVISVGGVHARPLTLSGDDLYSKNIRLQFGRCSVKTFYEPALAVLRANQELFSSFVENLISWDEAEEFYKLFEQNKVSKTVFVAHKA